MAFDTSTTHVLVKSTNPYRDGGYTRHGFRFSRDYRALKISETDKPDEGLVTLETAKKLDLDPFLAAKAASAADAAIYTAPASGDKDGTIDDLRRQNAELEARLMRLEQAAAKSDAKSDAEAKAKK